MGDESELRRRRGSWTGRPESTPRANTMENRGSASGIAAIVVSELSSNLEQFTRQLRLNDMKPWGEFFARFKPPRAFSTKVLDERLTTNFLHYRGNYSGVCAVFLIIGIGSNPSVLLALLCCALLLTFLCPSGDNPREVMIGERKLGNSERSAAAVIGVACILGLSGAWSTIGPYGFSGVFLCLAHGVFRPRSNSSKATRMSMDAKQAARGFSIEGAQNFVEGMFGMNTRSQ